MNTVFYTLTLVTSKIRFSICIEFREELDIDLSDIYYKVCCVLFPLPYFRLKLCIVRECPDFWGPLFIVSTYALLSLYGQLSVRFCRVNNTEFN